MLLQVSHPSKVASREQVLGIKKSAPAPPRPKSLKVSLRRHLIASLRPPEPKKQQQQTTSITTPSSTPTSRFLTKAEKKADLASHMYHQQHHGHGALVGSGGVTSGAGAGGGGGSGGGGLIVTQGETKNLSVPLSNVAPPPPPRTPSASPTPSPAPPDEGEELVSVLCVLHFQSERFCVTNTSSSFLHTCTLNTV